VIVPSPRFVRRLLWPLACLPVVALVACSSPPVLRTETYRCPGGQQFSLATGAREGPRLEWNDMSFALHAEPGREGVYTCEVLSVWRDGRRASLDLQGQPALRDCVRVP
jgi:hypothetical protein